MEDVKVYLNAAEEDMEMAAMNLDEKLSRIRAGIREITFPFSF